MESTASVFWPSLFGHNVLRLGSLLSSRTRRTPTLKGAEPPYTTLMDCSTDVGEDWCRTKANEYGQLQCRGCDVICSLMRWGEVQRRQDAAYQGTSQLRIFHSNYRELELCAVRSACDTCRIIQRAFLLSQITVAGSQNLEDPDEQWPVSVALRLDDAGDSLLLSIHTLAQAVVPLGKDKCPAKNDPTRGERRLRADFHELRQVIRDCHDHHECSWKYRWSDRNPSWLLEILPGNHVRLVQRPASPVDYVVLSYSWGDPTTMPASEWARIKGAATKSKDGLPVLDRLQPFEQWILPETMQDAISITHSLGFRYLWIDSVCIPKGTNWDTEASLMHEVYGNAAFTLVASSSTKATDRMLHDRMAWRYRNKACKLRGKWLHNDHITLDHVRLGSPVAQRGWTLQEERLSPRILYWTGQRWHWSCPESQITELGDMGSAASPDVPKALSPPQRFLDVCRTGDEQQLNDEWLDIVEAYSRRDLAHSKDRFLAISGLAVRFYNAKVEGGERLATEAYLAGLWRDNLARQLAWTVERGANAENTLHHIAPSWSWASLPLKVRAKTKHEFKESEHFQFLGSSPAPPKPTDNKTCAQLVEEQGRIVKTIEVRGRLRRFIAQDAQKVCWDDIEGKQSKRAGYHFSMLPGQSIFAVNAEDGRIVSKEAHRGELVGQLDYLAARPRSDEEKRNPGACLPDGMEKELMCLELGDSAMLLLHRVPDQPDGYRRVGICLGYSNRKGFFYGCGPKVVRLC